MCRLTPNNSFGYSSPKPRQERAMRIEDGFTPEEWSKVVASPMLAGMAVTAAEPSGLLGAVQESFSVASALRDARITPAGNALIDAVTAAYESSAGRDMARTALGAIAREREPAAITAAVVAELGTISATVAAKAPEQAEDFRAWLRGIAGRVAEASTEGGFLGFGGERVSAAEHEALKKIDRALG